MSLLSVPRHVPPRPATNSCGSSARRPRRWSADEEIVKPAPAHADAWSHPYHGPDNNPQSTDQIARAPYLTQFLADPMFVPMPEVSVAAGGRVFRAFGHIAHKANQNAMLNTLIASTATTARSSGSGP